ncbi:hypothetical protein G7047_28550 [Diaphorobacter sp. HDW4A]|uniref:hypothetical protein n=1 Tax=Diaphorobacter sp. HDW4A TaxID=2714924 RepID=UPI00140DE37A|nr:hypothetical protein [Diaphorobacter sp. HDW4A]QIL83455.1 hypothetical protein G7047_28550 [Diaphorobacter sp. HDW4A]
MSDVKRLFAEGATDAVGFLGGALLGFSIGYVMGLDIFSQGYDTRSILAIALVGLGGGVGLNLARRWRNSRATASAPTKGR